MPVTQHPINLYIKCVTNFQNLIHFLILVKSGFQTKRMNSFLLLTIILPIALGFSESQFSVPKSKSKPASNSIGLQNTMCPDGRFASKSCSRAFDCTNSNEYCFQNKSCCQIPICLNGQVGMQPCSTTNPCPSSYICFQGACCPEEHGVGPQTGRELDRTTETELDRRAVMEFTEQRKRSWSQSEHHVSG